MICGLHFSNFPIPASPYASSTLTCPVQFSVRVVPWQYISLNRENPDIDGVFDRVLSSYYHKQFP
jgi:hypothetical protein